MILDYFSSSGRMMTRLYAARKQVGGWNDPVFAASLVFFLLLVTGIV